MRPKPSRGEEEAIVAPVCLPDLPLALFEAREREITEYAETDAHLKEELIW